MIYYKNDVFAFQDGVIFRLRGSVIPLALAFSVPSGLFAVFLMYFFKDEDAFESGVTKFLTKDFGGDTLTSSQLWAAMMTSLAFLVGFRTNKAYQRFWDGTTLLNQMWGEWFDASSCLFSFSHLARDAKPLEVKNFRHTLVRLMSLMHGSALEEIAQSDNDPDGGYQCLDLGGLDITTLKWLKNCKFGEDKFNRVEVLIHMIQNLIVENQDIGVLKIPPPILSRVFQTISRGQVNLANCKKIVYTLFPFPFAQLISWLLIVINITTPIVMSSILENPHWAFVFTVMPVFGVTALNLVAKELEMPFGKDPNDLPLDDFQTHMNESMLMLIRDESDIVPCITRFAAPDFKAIKESISSRRPKDFIQELEQKHSMTGLLDGIDKGERAPKIEEKKGANNGIDKLPEAAASVPQQVPALNAASAPAPSVGQTMLDHVMQTKLEMLSTAFDGLTQNANELSGQLSTSKNNFQAVLKNTSTFSTQLAQSSQAMLEYSKVKDAQFLPIASAAADDASRRDAPASNALLGIMPPGQSRMPL